MLIASVRKLSTWLGVLLLLSLDLLPLSTTANDEATTASLYRDYLTQMIQRRDESMPPCDDFFEHACGGGTNASVDSAPPFLYNSEDRVRFFEDNRAQFATAPGQMLRNLYDECKDRTRYDVVRGRRQPQWQRMLAEIDFLADEAHVYQQHWPFLQHQWAALNERHELDWIALAAQFAAHGVPTLLDISFAENTIFVAAVADVSCRGMRTTRTALRAGLLGRRSPQALHVIASELWTLCRQLQEQSTVEEAVAQLEAPNDTAILVDDNTVAYLGHFFDALNLSETEVMAARSIPVDAARLEGVLRVLRSTPPRQLFNYVLWQAYDQLRYDDCFLLTEEFEQLLHAEYWHWDVFVPHFGRSVAMALYLLHGTRFQQHRLQVLMAADWDRFLFVHLQRRDFNVKRMITQHASEHLDVQNLTRLYAPEGEASFRPGEFYGNLLRLRRLRLRHSFFVPAIDDEDVNGAAYFLRQFLHFSILLLKQPLFHYFATQGLDQWRDSRLLHSSDELYTAADCLARQTLRHHDEAASPNLFHFHTEHEVKEIFGFYRAFTEAYRDYSFWLEGESFAFAEDFLLEYFRMSARRIMFYAVAQLYCDRNDRIFSALIDRSLMNMPAFQWAFNCENDAPMNPPDKCMASQGY